MRFPPDRASRRDSFYPLPTRLRWPVPMRHRLPCPPTMARFPFLDWPGPLAFAHQGAHVTGGPGENTMAAFEAAVALGYRYLETDAHVTADGVLVAFHDDNLDRLTDRAGVIGKLPWAEVRAARVRGHDDIPLLEDLLTAWPDVRINIDPKHDAAVDPLVDLIQRTGTIDRVCVGAFSDTRLARIRAALGERICTSMGPRQVRRLFAAARGVPAGRFSAACVQGPVRPGPVPLGTRRLLDLGVDGIMTDRPEVLKAVLEERDAWVG